MSEKTLEKMLQLALDYQEIQNVMGLHEYYHSARMHKEEFEELFAQKTPGISYEDQHVGRFEGVEAVRKSYVEGIEFQREEHLKKMRNLFPNHDFDDEDNFPGCKVIHTLTTPVIVVAEDGKTAKGVWISPGFITFVIGGKLEARWTWEKYAVDFVKEDGKWKFWHFSVYTDVDTPYEKSWVENSFEPRPPAGLPPPDILTPNCPATIDYPEYSPFVGPKLLPRPPKPYKTFEETFSY